MNASVVNIFILVYLITSILHQDVSGCSSKRISCLSETSYKFCFIVGKMVMEIGNIKYCPENTVCNEVEGSLPCLQDISNSESVYTSMEITDPPNEENPYSTSSEDFSKLEEPLSINSAEETSTSIANVTDEYGTDSIDDTTVLSSNLADNNIYFSEQDQPNLITQPVDIFKESSTYITIPSTFTYAEKYSPTMSSNSLDMSNSGANDMKNVGYEFLEVLKQEQNPAMAAEAEDVSVETSVPILKEYNLMPSNNLDTSSSYANDRDDDALKQEQNLAITIKDVLTETTTPMKDLSEATFTDALKEVSTVGLEETPSTSDRYVSMEPFHFDHFFDGQDSNINLLTTENISKHKHQDVYKGTNTEDSSNFKTKSNLNQKLSVEKQGTVTNSKDESAESPITFLKFTTPVTKEPVRTSFQGTHNGKPTTMSLEVQSVFTKGTTTEKSTSAQLRNQPISTKEIFSPTSDNPVTSTFFPKTKYTLSETSTKGSPFENKVTLSSSTSESYMYDLRKASPLAYLGIIGLLTVSTESTTRSMCQINTTTVTPVPNFKTDFRTTSTSIKPYTKASLYVCTATGRYPSQICNQYYECVRIMWWIQTRVRTCRFGEAFNSITRTCRPDNTCRGIYSY